MRRKVSLLLPILALNFILGSCSLLPGGGDNSDEPQTAQPVAPFPVIEDETPDLDATPPASASVFIPSTDPDQRRQVNAEGRTNPFSDLPMSPSIVFKPPTPAPPAPPSNGGSSTSGSSDSQPSGSTGASGTSGAGLGTGTIPGFDNPPSLPPLPTLAEEVQVTGVIRVNGVDNIILKAPGEEHSRTVRIGEYVSNGQIKVKSVDLQTNSPIVVLEQNGIEVVKQIDDPLLADRSLDDELAPEDAEMDEEAPIEEETDQPTDEEPAEDTSDTPAEEEMNDTDTPDEETESSPEDSIPTLEEDNEG